ncbi:hypothetical protein LCGC14_1131030 [marine sediment metagenome]|uniref:Uncharacterized protein n=1 Tax=marine sediment metagenome TaxID=412755 RepID=A0A0F9M0Z9_9ZZZZ
MAKKQSRNKQVLEACIQHSKNIKNRTTVGEFEKGEYIKDLWKESGRARFYNLILIVLKDAVVEGIYKKEVVNRKHYFILIGTEETVEDVEDEEDEETDEEEDMEDAIKDVLTEDDEEEEEEDEDEEEEEEEVNELYEQYKEETGKNAITTRGTESKIFIKWKKNQ